MSSDSCTLLPSEASLGGRAWPDWRIWRRNAEYDFDFAAVHFNAFDESANNFAPFDPVELLEPFRHLCGEVLQATDDKAEVALALRGSDGRVGR